MEFEFAYEKVLRVLRNSSGMTANQLAEIITDKNEQTVKSTIAHLKKRGCVEVVGYQPKPKGTRGRDPAIYRATGVPFEKTQLPQTYAPVGKREVQKTLSELEQLRMRVRELENWRNETLRRFPELATDENVLEARRKASEIARSKGNIEMVDLIEAGARDHIPLVQEILKTLRTLQ